jgi:hypothetical protein
MPFGFGRNKNPEPSEPQPEDTAGWDALAARLAMAFPDQEPEHWKPDDVLLPAQDGVWGISAYRAGSTWFYVTHGLTDLFGLFHRRDSRKVEPDVVKWSGFGFELTMRVLSNEPTPPLWPVDLLSELGKYVYRTKAGFENGHRLDPRGPITGHPDTRLTALAFATDPEFDAIDTPQGRVEFLTVFGITGDELAQMKATSTDAVLSQLRQQSPTLVTDPSR